MVHFEWFLQIWRLNLMVPVCSRVFLAPCCGLYFQWLDFSHLGKSISQILQVKRVTSGWATTSRPPCWRSRRVGRSWDGWNWARMARWFGAFFFWLGVGRWKINEDMDDMDLSYLYGVWAIQIWNMDDKWYGIFGITRITYDICMDFSRICWLRRFGTFWTECISSETGAWHAPGSRDAPGWWWFVPGRCRRERNIAGPRGCYNVDSDLSAVKHGRNRGKTM